MLYELTIRTLDLASNGEIEVVALRMRETLIEVLDVERGQSMYSLEWLVDRVRQHIDGRLPGEVFLACRGGEILGHSIVREEKSNMERFGLFSTVYVVPEYRKAKIASLLLEAGEKWMDARGLKRFVTYTSQSNEKLVKLFVKRGYSISNQFPEKSMIEISKALEVLPL